MSFSNTPTGQALVEYALIIALVAVGGILALESIGQSVGGTLANISGTESASTGLGGQYIVPHRNPLSSTEGNPATLGGSTSGGG